MLSQTSVLFSYCEEVELKGNLEHYQAAVAFNCGAFKGKYLCCNMHGTPSSLPIFQDTKNIVLDYMYNYNNDSAFVRCTGVKMVRAYARGNHPTFRECTDIEITNETTAGEGNQDVFVNCKRLTVSGMTKYSGGGSIFKNCSLVLLAEKSRYQAATTFWTGVNKKVQTTMCEPNADGTYGAAGSSMGMKELIEYYMNRPPSTAFANSTWAQIAEIAASGNARQHFNVGDEKSIQVGTQTVTLQILGFNHDDKADGSGKAGITFGMKNLLTSTYKMNATNTTVGGWHTSQMRTANMPALFDQLPSDLQAVIKLVNKPATAGAREKTITVSQDKLFLFSKRELVNHDGEGYINEGEQYEIYAGEGDKTTLRFVLKCGLDLPHQIPA